MELYASLDGDSGPWEEAAEVGEEKREGGWACEGCGRAVVVSIGTGRTEEVGAEEEDEGASRTRVAQGGIET